MKSFAVTCLSAAAVATVAVGGVTAGQFLSGGGTQPEDVLPANTVAFAKLDFDPSAGQKLNALRLLHKFPSITTHGNDLKATVVSGLLEDNAFGLDYAKDIAPWMGDRAAAAILPAPGTDDNITPILVLEFTDRQRMTAALDKVSAHRPGKHEPFDYAVRDSYVFLGDDQGELNRAVAARRVLSDDATFAADKASVDGENQVALGWVDIGSVYDLTPESERGGFAASLGSAEPSGRFVAGVHVEPGYVEMTGRTHGLKAAGVEDIAGSEPGTGLVTDFPADMTGVMSVTNLGPAAAELWKRLGSDGHLGLDSEAKTLGLDMPADLVAALGEESAIGLRFNADSIWDIDFVGRVRTNDADRAMLATKALTKDEPDIRLRRTGEGYAVASSSELAAASTDGNKALGYNPRFRGAVKDADTANALLYVDIAGLVDNLLTSPGEKRDRMNLAPLSALGISATGTPENGEVTARLTFR